MRSSLATVAVSLPSSLWTLLWLSLRRTGRRGGNHCSYMQLSLPLLLLYAPVACGRHGHPTSIAMDVAVAVAGADAGPLLWQTLQLKAAEATAIAAAFVAFVARPSS